MYTLKQYESTPTFDPMNPYQRIREIWGQLPEEGWRSHYWNPVEVTGQLRGLGMWSTLPGWGQLAIVGAGAALVGYFGMAKYGDKYVKPALKKVGLAGLVPRRRRSRRK